MGGAGDPPAWPKPLRRGEGPPAPVGDSPIGTAASNVAKKPCAFPGSVAPVPSGESPDGTGGSPVLPVNNFSNTHSVAIGSNPELTEYLQTNRYHIAQHGYHHDYFEFDRDDRVEIERRLEQGARL